MTQIIPCFPETLSATDAVDWLRESIAAVGPGFHFDTAGSEYVDDSGAPSFSAEAAARLDRGLATALTILDRDAFEKVCLEEVWRGLGVRYDPVSELLVSVTD